MGFPFLWRNTLAHAYKSYISIFSCENSIAQNRRYISRQVDRKGRKKRHSKPRNPNVFVKAVAGRNGCPLVGMR